MPVDRKADEEAIDRVLAGDRDAFAVLVDRHGGRVHGAILRMVGDPEAANDLAQETFLRAWAGLRNFRRGSAFYTWLYAIAVNQVRTEFRKRRSVKGQAMLPLETAAGRGPGGDAEGRAAEPAGPGPAPSDVAEGREEAERLHGALAGLDPEYREAVVLRDLEGLTYEEIAEATATPVGTVRSRIHRGRAALREALVPERRLAGGGR